MATRLYFPASDASPVNPAFDTEWEYVSEALRRKLADTKGSSAITIGTQIGPWTPGQDALDRQYVSTRMNAGIVFTAGVTTYKGQLMTREYNNGDNVDRIRHLIKIVSDDGSVTRVELTGGSIVSSTSVAEFINNVSHRNKQIKDSTIVTDSYTTVLGDRLVIEIGYTDSGASPEASAKWGENATDLPENETQTTDGAGWIEFSNTITFAGESNNYELDFTAGSYLISGNAASLKWNRLIPITAGSYAVTGNNVNLSKGYKLTVEAGTYSVSGQNATLKADRKLSFSAGSYSVSGNSVNLSKGHKITIQDGSYSISGESINLRWNRKLSPDQGVYSVSGNAVNLLRGLRLAVEQGSYSITGNSVNLIHDQPGSYTLPAEAGVYSISGNNVGLRWDRRLSTEQGTYLVTGNDATLTHGAGGYTLSIQPGVYTVTGNNVNLSHGVYTQYLISRIYLQVEGNSKIKHSTHYGSGIANEVEKSSLI